MSRLSTLAGVALLAAGSAATAGCLKAQARTPTASPALTVPAPPSRTVVPSTVSLDPIPAAPDTSAAAANPAPKPAEPPPAPRSSPPATTPPTTPPSPTVETPAPVLQTTPDVSGLEAKVKATLTEADGLLSKLEFNALGREAKDHYNTAVGYVRMAREALGYKSFPYAQALADKALVLAKQLNK